MTGFGSLSNPEPLSHSCAAGVGGHGLSSAPTVPRCCRPREQFQKSSSDARCRNQSPDGVHRHNPLAAENLLPPAHQCEDPRSSERLPSPATEPVLPRKGASPGRECWIRDDASYLAAGRRQTALFRPCVTPKGRPPKGPAELDSRRNPRSSSPRDTENRMLPEGFCNRDDPRAQPVGFPSLKSTPKGPHTLGCESRRLPASRSE